MTFDGRPNIISNTNLNISGSLLGKTALNYPTWWFEQFWWSKGPPQTHYNSIESFQNILISWDWNRLNFFFWFAPEQLWTRRAQVQLHAPPEAVGSTMQLRSCCIHRHHAKKPFEIHLRLQSRTQAPVGQSQQTIGGFRLHAGWACKGHGGTMFFDDWLWKSISFSYLKVWTPQSASIPHSSIINLVALRENTKAFCMMFFRSRIDCCSDCWILFHS